MPTVDATFIPSGGAVIGKLVLPEPSTGPVPPGPGDAHPEHPIVIIPPDAVAPGVPAHPIFIPVYPAHPIVIPPDAIAPGVPAHPIYLPPPTPAHPIEIPPGSIDPGPPPVPAHPIELPPPVYPAHPIAGLPDTPPVDPPTNPPSPDWEWGFTPVGGGPNDGTWLPVYVPGDKPHPVPPPGRAA